MMRPVSVPLLASLFSLIALEAVAQARIWPDPFAACDQVTAVLRASPAAEGVIVTGLGETVRINAPSSLDVSAEDNSIPATVTLQFGGNSCYYKASSQSYFLDSCINPKVPSGYAADSVSWIVPGLHHFSRVSISARFDAVAPCSGRSPLNGKRFFQRDENTELGWLVVLEEKTVSDGAIGEVATGLTNKYGGQVGPLFRTPRGFVLFGSAEQAKSMSGDLKYVRFIESNTEVRGTGIRFSDSAQWAQDRLDESTENPLDKRYRYPAARKPPAEMPRIWSVDTEALTSHPTFGQLGSKQSVTNLTPRAGCTLGLNIGNRASHGTMAGSAFVGDVGTAADQASSNIFVKGMGVGVGNSAALCDFATPDEIVQVIDGFKSSVRAGDVINFSLQGSKPSGTFEMAIADLIARGAVVVAAAGNEGMPVALPPANVPGVIAVGGTDRSGARYSLSNFGAAVRVNAPAKEVYLATDAPDVFRVFEGTSVASPLVAGLALFHSASIPGPSLGPGTSAEVSRRLQAMSVENQGFPIAVQQAAPLEQLTTPLPAALQGASITGLVAGAFAGDLWVGRASSVGTSVSLARIPIVNGSPQISAMQTVRQVSEWCLPLTNTGGGNTMLVACKSNSTGTSSLLHYLQDGSPIGVSLGVADPNLSAAVGAADYDVANNPNVAAVAFDHSSGDSVSVALVGGNPYTGLNIAWVLLQPDWTNRRILAKAAALNCDRVPGSCDAYILVSEEPKNPLAIGGYQWRVSVRRIEFKVIVGTLPPPTITVLGQATVSSVQRTLDPFLMCSAAWSPGLSGVGITADHGTFQYAYSETRFDDLGRGCQFSGRTRVVDSNGVERDTTPVGVLAQAYATNRFTNSSVALASQFTAGALLVPPVTYATNVDLVGRTRVAPISITSSQQRGNFVTLDDAYRATILSSASNTNWVLHWVAP